jgi:uncharacterized protein YggE
MSFRNRWLLALAFTSIGLVCNTGKAQISGNRATSMTARPCLPLLSVAAANSHITVDGKCQKRVTPTSMRLIWAITSEAQDAASCRKETQSKVEKMTASLLAMRLDKEDIFEDFISAIPRFEWTFESKDGENILIEKQTGYRMQTNLHIAVKTNEQAMKVIEQALAQGLTDLIGVDYAADLEQVQEEARRGAIAAAKKKAETVLNAVFDAEPKVINVQEQTQVWYPHELYRSFENVASNNLTTRYDDRRNRVEAYRPKNTYYAGQTKPADKKSYALPMKPEIVVESRVVIYYQSPSTRLPVRQDNDENPLELIGDPFE